MFDKVHKPSHAQAISSIWRIVEFGTLIAAAGLTLLAARSLSSNPYELISALIVIVLVGAIVIFFSGRQAELWAQHARDLRAQKIFHQVQSHVAPSSFCLYLRPFASTGAVVRHRLQPRAVSNRSIVVQGETLELEEQLERACRRVAPLVCLGRPRGHIGAGRIPTEEDTWKAVIDKLMEHASLIVMLPSSRAGTRHELERILTSDLIDKTVFIDPPRSEKIWKSFDEAGEWSELRELFLCHGRSLPEHSDKGAVFFFDAQGGELRVESLEIEAESRMRRLFRRVTLSTREPIKRKSSQARMAV